MDALREQLHAEALRRKVGQAAGALVIGESAVTASGATLSATDSVTNAHEDHSREFIERLSGAPPFPKTNCYFLAAT